MSQTMKVIKNANPGLAQTQVFALASKQLSGQNKNGGTLGIGALTGLLGSKLFGRGLSLAPPRGTGMYLKPYR